MSPADKKAFIIGSATECVGVLLGTLTNRPAWCWIGTALAVLVVAATLLFTRERRRRAREGDESPWLPGMVQAGLGGCLAMPRREFLFAGAVAVLAGAGAWWRFRAGRGTRYEGSVKDKSRTPCLNVQVVAWPVAPLPPEVFTVGRGSRTDDSGHFTLFLAPGEQMILLWCKTREKIHAMELRRVIGENSTLEEITDFPMRESQAAADWTMEFDSNKSDLDPHAQATAKKLGTAAGTAGWVVVAGHTDDNGSKNQNIQLGLDRANEVAKALVGQDVDRSRIVCVSFGQTYPISAAGTKRAQAMNRRVEVYLLPA